MSFNIYMERVDREGHISTAYYKYNPTEKVRHLVRRCLPGEGNPPYRLAYGTQIGLERPLSLQWTAPLSDQYDPSLQDLFSGTTLAPRPDYSPNAAPHHVLRPHYFLLLSDLQHPLRSLETRDDPVFAAAIQKAVYRYKDLFTRPAHTPPPPPQTHPLHTHTHTQPGSKRPPPAPADGAAPTARPRTSLAANLAALKACSTQL